MSKFGNSAILWTSTEDANTQRVFLLDAPLRDVRPSHTMAAWRRESLDRTNVETFSIGNGAYELEGTVRYSGNPAGLVDVIKAGSQGKTLTYVPNLADSAVRHSVVLISPMSPAGLELDRDRGVGYGESEQVLRFRRTDEKAFTPAPRGTDVLFAYHAGDSLKDATFTRATSTSAPATYPTLSTADGGYGRLSTAATNKARLGWFASPSSVGPRTFPALLQESSRKNWVDYSEDFGQWTLSNASRTSGQSDPLGGTAAWLISDNSTSQYGSIARGFSVTASTFRAFSIFLKQGTTQAAGGVAAQIDYPAQTNYAAFQLVFSSGVPTMSTAGGGSRFTPERWGGGWWRFAVRSTAAVSTGTATITITPAAGSSGQKGSVYVFGAQLE